MVRPGPSAPLGPAGRFFPRRAAGPRLPHPVGGPVAQTGLGFLAAAPDRIDMQAGDLGQQDVAAMAVALGLQAGEPTSLLLVQATHDEVDLLVALPLGMGLSRLTRGAGTAMDRGRDHGSTSVTGNDRPRPLYEKLGSHSWTAPKGSGARGQGSEKSG